MNTRRYVIFLIIALLAFLIGITAATVFGGLTSNPAKTKSRCGTYRVSVERIPVGSLKLAV